MRERRMGEVPPAHQTPPISFNTIVTDGQSSFSITLFNVTSFSVTSFSVTSLTVTVVITIFLFQKIILIFVNTIMLSNFPRF